MTNRLTAARRDLVASITAPDETKVHEVLPAKINSRRAIAFSPAPDYALGPEDYGRSLTLSVSAWLLVSPRNDVADAEDLDELFLALYDGLPPGWAITTTDEPDVLRYGDWAMYGTRLTLTRIV